MNDKAGQLGGGAAWLFPTVAAVVATLLAYLSLKMNIPGKILYLLHFGIFGAAAWASVFLTKAGKGTAIGASFVGATLLAIGTFFVTKAVVAAAVTTGIDTTDAAGKANGHLALSEGAGNVAGAIGGILIAIVNFVVAAAGGIAGAIAGGKTKAAAQTQGSQGYAQAA